MTNGEQEVTLVFEPVFVPESQIIIPLTRVPEKPTPTPYFPPAVPEKNPLILNIETSGFNPLKNRIISIGLQDPTMPDQLPTVIMLEDEALMLSALFTTIKDFGYNQAVGYGFSFDFRFIVLKAMKHGITCKEFVDMDIYDLGQAMAQVKMQFMYFPQRQPKLSDVADFYWGYPKPFTDLEMLKYWKLGQLDKVVEFTSSQITRILLLYSLFRQITESSFIPPIFEGGGGGVTGASSLTPLTAPQLTIPQAQPKTTDTFKCSNCLAEFELSKSQPIPTCLICGTKLKQFGGI